MKKKWLKFGSIGLALTLITALVLMSLPTKVTISQSGFLSLTSNIALAVNNPPDVEFTEQSYQGGGDITLVGDASDFIDNASSVTIDVSGIGIQDDDLILFFGSADGGAHFNDPNDFTLLYDVSIDGINDHVTLYYKVASSEPSSYYLTISGTDRAIAIFAVYRGVDPADPIDASNSNIGGENLTGVITSITPTNDNSAVVVFIGLESGNAGNPVVISWPGSLVEQLDNVNGPPGTGGGSASAAYADEIQTSKAAVSGNILLTGGTTYWAVMAAVLNPAAVGPEADISNTPDNKAFGILELGTSAWSSGSEPSWPLDDGESYFTITNNGDPASITIEATNFTGTGIDWTLGVPAANVIRIKAGKSGDANENAMVTLTNSPQAFISGLVTSIKWEIKLDMPTSSDKYEKISIITLVASLN